jgi:hypothetical protein
LAAVPRRSCGPLVVRLLVAALVRVTALRLVRVTALRLVRVTGLGLVGVAALTLRVAALVRVACLARRGVAGLVWVAALTCCGVAGLAGVAALFWVAAALVVATLFWVAAALVVATLFWVAAALVVATLFWVAAALVVAALTRLGWRIALLGRVAALLRRIRGARVRRGRRILLRTAVVVIAGPSLPLTPAVARIVSHLCYSWFCAERLIRLWPDEFIDRRAGLDVGVDSTAGAELAGVQVR